MVESGVTERGKTLPVFFFVTEHNNTNKKPRLKAVIFKDILKEKQQLVEETYADIIRKVLCKSFMIIQSVVLRIK